MFKNVIRIDLDENISDNKIYERFILVQSSFDIEKTRGVEIEKAYIVKQYPIPHWLSDFKEHCHYRKIEIDYID